jgi:hypothetical protein
MRYLTTCTLLVLLAGCGAQPTKPSTTSSNVTPPAPAAPVQATPAASVQAAPAASVQAAPAASVQAAPTASVQATPAASAQAAPAGAAETAPPAPGDSAPAGAVKPPPGFRVVKRNGQELYCRSEATIGSKFKETLCYTRDQLNEISERTDNVMDVIGRGCAGGGCSAD